MADDRLRSVRFLEVFLLFLSQCFPTSLQRLVHSLDARESNNRGADSLVDPCQGDMAHLPSLLFRQLLHSLYDLLVSLAQFSTVLLLSLAPQRTAKRLQRPRQMSATQWGPGNQSHARRVTEGVHLPLLLAVQQVVVVLHADELGPSVLLSAVLHQRELPRPHAARADVVHLACTHEIVQSLHGLFNWCVRVEAVDLQQVEVLQLQAGEGGVNCFEDRGAGEAWESLLQQGLLHALFAVYHSPPRFT